MEAVQGPAGLHEQSAFAYFAEVDRRESQRVDERCDGGLGVGVVAGEEDDKATVAAVGAFATTFMKTVLKALTMRAPGISVAMRRLCPPRHSPRVGSRALRETQVRGCC